MPTDFRFMFHRPLPVSTPSAPRPHQEISQGLGRDPEALAGDIQLIKDDGRATAAPSSENFTVTRGGFQRCWSFGRAYVFSRTNVDYRADHNLGNLERKKRVVRNFVKTGSDD